MTLFFVKNYLNKAKKLTIGTLVITMVFGSFIPFFEVKAADPLQISNISVTYTDKTATITWNTNRAAAGKVEYGLFTGSYHWTLQTNVKNTTQVMTIQGLYPESTYYFIITASDDTSQVISTEQNFKTGKATDNQAPDISAVGVMFTTGTTATIQWLTNEDATSEVDYGMTTTYGSSKVDGTRVRNHDITLTGLKEGTQYHYRVKSKDKDNNISTWYDLTFQTKNSTA